MAPSRRRGPLESSDGTSPTNAPSCRGDVEAREVAELGDDGDRDEPLDAAQRLQRLDDGIEPPRRRPLEQLGLEPMHPIDLLIDGADRFLKHDLLRRGRADDLGQIPSMRVVPVGAADIVAARAAAGTPSAAAWHS